MATLIGELGTTHAAFLGAGTNEAALRIAGMNLAVHGVGARLDPISNSPWDKSRNLRISADLVVTNPPFNDTSPGPTARRDGDWILGPPPKGNDNLAWLQVCLETLNPGGQAAIVLPNQAAVSTNSTEREIRHELVERGHLACVIALPRGLFSTTTVPVTIWLLEADGGNNGVLFVDAGKIGSRSAKGRCTLSEGDVQSVAMAYQTWRTDCVEGKPHVGRTDFSVWIPTARIHASGDVLHPRRYVARQPGRLADLRSAFAELDTRRHAADETDASAASVRRSYDGTVPAAAMAAWDHHALADLYDIQAGPSPARVSKIDRSPTGDVPLVSAKHLRDWRVARPEELITTNQALEFRKFTLLAGDLLCARTGTMGPVALVREGQEDWLFSSNLIRLRQRRECGFILRPDFLLAYMSLPSVQGWILDRSEATAVRTISCEALGQLPVPLPPMDEQYRMGIAVAACDEQIAAYRDLVEAMTVARTALDEQLLANMLAVPDSNLLQS